MIGSLLQRWRARRERQLLDQFAIPDALWTLTLAQYPFIARRSEEDRTELSRLG